MKKLFKILGIILVLFIGILVAIPLFFKDDIVKIVKKEANNAVNARIEFGDFDLSLIKSFPDFYLSVENISISGIGEFDSIQLAGIKELNLVVDLQSVIKGESINVKQVKLVQPAIFAKVLKDGTANYLIVKEDSAMVDVPDTTTSGSFKMDLQQLEIIDGIVIYEDDMLPLAMNINNLDLNLSGDFTETVTNLTTKGEIEKFNLTFDGIQYLADAKVLLDAVLQMNLDEMKFTFKENKIQVNDLPIGFDGWVAMPNDPIDMDLTFQAKDADFKILLSLVPAAFTKDLEGVETSGKLSLDGYAKGTFIDTIYPGFGLNLIVENARLKYPDLPKSIEDIQIRGSVKNEDGNLDHTIVDIPVFHMNMANNPFDMNLYLATPISDPFIKASAKGKLVLSNVRDIIPLEKNDELTGTINADVSLEGNVSALESENYESFKSRGVVIIDKLKYASDSLDYPIEVNKMDVEFTPSYLALKQADVKLGQSDINATGRVENFIAYALRDNQILRGNLTIQSNYLNINELAGIDPNAVQTTPTGNTSGEAVAPMEVVVLPKNINFVTNATIGKLIFDNVEITDIAGKIDFNNQKVAMKNTAMKLLGGNMMMSGFYETTDSLKPTYDFGMDIKNFNLSKTLETFTSIGELVPLAKFAKGNYSTNLSVNGALNEVMEPIFESIFGNGSMFTSDMVIEGYKPLDKLSKLIKYNQLNPLNINNQNIKFKMAEGKVFVEPFDFKIGDTKLTIAGSNSFDQTIDYTFSLAIPRKELGGSVNALADGLLSQASSKGLDLNLAEIINIDVNMVGPFTDPSIKTDLKKSASNATQAIKDKAKEEIDQKKEELKQQAQEEIDQKKAEAEKRAQEEIEKQKEEARKKLQDEANKKLKGLFGK